MRGKKVLIMVKKSLIIFAAMFALFACAKGGPDMAFVPEGEFQMGSPLGTKDELSEKVFVKAFYIDKHEVTNGRYKAFVDASKRQRPKDWDAYGYSEERKDYPVVLVSFDDAVEFCKWDGKRLPIEEEWEKAARGTDGRIYPWGNAFDKDKANTSLSGVIGVTKAGRYEAGKSPYGVYDMAGNVWEWTGTDFDERGKAVRGGSWGLTHRFATTFSRVGYIPVTKINNLGFRCVKDG